MKAAQLTKGLKGFKLVPAKAYSRVQVDGDTIATLYVRQKSGRGALYFPHAKVAGLPAALRKPLVEAKDGTKRMHIEDEKTLDAARKLIVAVAEKAAAAKSGTTDEHDAAVAAS
jgi:hypothetical protein